MNALYFNVAAVMLAAVSALFWVLSAQVRFQFGYDITAVRLNERANRCKP
jgi:ABC-type branched-subunit amino acid transport system permease subunit